MTQQFSHSVATVMAGEVVKARHLVQSEIFIARNFLTI